MHGHVVSAPAQPPPDPIPQCSSLEAETWIEQSPINSATLPIYVNPLLFCDAGGGSKMPSCWGEQGLTT